MHRGDRTSVSRALAALLDGARPLDAEQVDVVAGAGRVLAEHIVSPVDVPAFRKSAVDGFAVRSASLRGASEDAPVWLALAGEALPGSPPDRSLGPDSTLRVATGAPLPDEADAVVMQELVRVDAEGAVAFHAATQPGKHAIARGEDVRAGEALLAPGRRLRPQDAGLLASLGLASVTVRRCPRVAIVVTGDEIRAPGSPARGTEVIDSNSIVLAALARRDGAIVSPPRYVPDRPDALAEALVGSDADVVLVSGGSSVGPEDHAPAVVRELGALVFHGVAMRPGGPVGFGRIGPRTIGLMPGHPVACLVAYEMFSGPLLRTLGGRSAAWPHAVLRAPLAEPLTSERGRTDVLRARLLDGRVSLLAHGGASSLSSAVRSDGLLVVDDATEHLDAGALVEVRSFDS
jgi:molybdopterin molybdotransferase